MEWTDDGVLLSCRPQGESAAVVEVMTRQQGRHLGLVRSARSPRMTPLLQPGNTLRVTWRARLPGQLGLYSVEGLSLRAGFLMQEACALYGVQHLAALTRLLPERAAHEGIFQALTVVLDHLHEPLIAGPLIVRYELALLTELGFGLDLSRCAATGQAWDLAYVSPKSARAVSRDAGAPYRDKLLPLPAFLVEGERQPGTEINFTDLSGGFTLTAFFLDRHVTGPAGLDLSTTRTGMTAAFAKAYEKAGLMGFTG